MTKSLPRDSIYSKRQFDSEIIVVAREVVHHLQIVLSEIATSCCRSAGNRFRGPPAGCCGKEVHALTQRALAPARRQSSVSRNRWFFGYLNDQDDT